MRRTFLLAALALGALSACAATERPGRAMRWTVSASAAEGAKLALGVPGSDDVRMMLTCQVRSGRVDVTVVARPDDPATLELRSGEVFARYAGAGHADEATPGAVDIDFSVPATDPVLARLADTGQLTLVFPTRRIVLPNAFAEAHDFLRLCRAP